MDKRQLAPHTAIVAALKKYGEVDIYFLAKRIGRRPTEIEKLVQVLEADGVVFRNGDIVGLNPDPPTEIS